MTAELMRGDPDISDISQNEILSLTPTQENAINSITRMPAPTDAIVPVKNPQQLFTEFVLKSAGAEADEGVSRTTDKVRVTQYLDLFGLDFADPANGHPYAYCAAGLGWAACRAYCTMSPPVVFESLNPPTPVFRSVVPIIARNYFLPHPSCLSMVNDAKQKGRWIGGHTSIPEPGWIVFYNWDGGGAAQHVGIVESADADTLRTIEFNTGVPNQPTGGAVARKNRDTAKKFVIGYERTWIPEAPTA
jgi:hypothetical protein